MEEEEDVKIMTDFIKKQKSSYDNNYDSEFQDFVNFKNEYNSDQDFDDEDLEEDNVAYGFDVKQLSSDPLAEQDLVLTEEEQTIINSCTDPDLEKLLILNRTKNMQLMHLHKKIQQFLLECEDEIEEKRNKKKMLKPKHTTQSFVWKLAAPYFKDKKFYPCPQNEEFTKKRLCGELSIYEMAPSPKWTTIEFDRLLNAVKCNYNINRQNAVVAKITALKAKMNDDNNKECAEEIVKLKDELEKLKIDDQIPPLNTNEHINWYKVADSFYRDKRTATECQSVWHMVVHPDINNSPWSEEENKKLMKIAKKFSHQNWDGIASQLNTKRTGFTVCLHFFSKLCDKFKKTKFTAEEDKFLLKIIDIYKIGNYIPWNKVVCHFTDRSRHQLYHRYTYYLSYNGVVKKGKFSEAEDILLLVLVNKFGRNFKKCEEYMPNRSLVQLKSRYNSNLSRVIKKGSFQVEEDKKIFDFAQGSNVKWSVLAGLLNRCNAQIRHRYKVITDFLEQNPNSTIEEVPRRTHTSEEINEERHNFINFMAKQYQDVDFIPTLKMVEESLQASSLAQQQRVPSSETKLKNIDSLLTDFFVNSKKTRESNVITESSLLEATEHVYDIFKAFGANIELPDNLEANPHLDIIDVEILERLATMPSTSDNVLNKILPPNLSTLQGLKSLIVKHKEFKQKTCEVKDQEDTPEIRLHRELFSKRFDVLYYWSAILSLQRPNNVESTTEIESPSDSVTSKKRSQTEYSSVAKKLKVDEASPSSKQTPRKSDKKNSKIETSSSKCDKRDLERLNAVLQSMNSCGSSSSNCNELEALNGDVHLLNEIIKYEKTKVKLEPNT